MASPASLASLGSARPVSPVVFEISASPVTVRRIHVVSSIRFGSFGSSRQWSRARGRVCKCMVTTNLIEERDIPFTPESTLKASNSSGSREDDTDLILKPAPKPVLKARPSVPVGPSNSASAIWSSDKAVREKPVNSVEDRTKVIESLGEVLEKVEKLETTNEVKLGSKDIKDNAASNGSTKPIRSNNETSAARKTKTLKSVWRKGNPVATVQKVVKEMPKPNEEERKDPPGTSLRPQMTSPTRPKLQPRPPVAPPTPPMKKPDAPKERKPILIDKFAQKKPAIDPIAAEAVLATPLKPAKGSPPSKVKDERRKKSSTTGSLRRRIADEGVISEEEASELNVSIPGARKGRKWSKASRKAARLQAAKAAEPVKVEILEVGEEGMLTEELAYNLAVSEADILTFLFSKGVKPDAVQTLDKDMVKMICKEYDVEVIEVDPIRVEEMAKKKEVLDEEDLDMLEDRPPVITIMGHVDHGKTTLLDYIRKSRVVASEAGGITQGIGAYKVLVPVDGKPQSCVFLDTPGHEAFGAMRARGARVTDIVIIVVAADDGVRPQTSEAIAHAKAAGVPIVIAINKIDKDGANPERVMQELSSVGLMPEVWGGDIPMVQISALKGENVDELLETVMLVAELQELKANPKRNAIGTVIEAGLDKAKGAVATLIVQKGTLKKSDVVVCGEAFGKVRAMFDDRGGRVDEAGPSTAVQVIGLSSVPIAGDEFEVVESLDVARERAEACAQSLRVARISAKAGETKVTLSSIASAVATGKKSGLDMHQLNIILKVDVQGSIEAIRQALQVLPQDNVNLKFLLQAPGEVSNSDVDLAVASEAIIFGFNVKVSGSVKSYADKKNVEIRLYKVIYDLIDDMRNAMEGLLEPVEEQVPIGTAEVRATFSSGSGRVAGCMVTEGKVVKECGVRVIRNGKTVHTGIMDSLRRVKEDVKEVGAGLECGIGVVDFDDWESGDVIEAFNTVKKQRTLEEASASVTAALVGAGVER
ncbi:translation initiation factor IF-2, chloroplastic-like [Canna indica]|uniref:Translation initiation factor IF-2, chloroplastic n=1 Tax=Canna indica TaxID=4628 RepID=A0AAQ3KCY2_9LILI|nr:translation initiation factor IF-2, chloroplastic-like [Canna indica]